MKQAVQLVEWRCRSCGALLGVRRGNRIDLRYKTARYSVRGEVRMTCRRCSTFNSASSVQPASVVVNRP